MTVFRHESFLLELPFDAGLPVGFVLHVKDDDQAPITPGWGAFDLNGYLGLSGPPLAHNIPSTTLMFKVAPGHAIRPRRNAERAWPRIFKWQRSSLSFPLRVVTSAPVRIVVRGLLGPPTLRKPVSVVQAVRLAPRPPQYDEDWRWNQLSVALDHLNEFLTGIMSVRRDPEVTAIGLRDLPPLVLGFGWDLHADGARSPVESQAYLANDRVPLDHPRMTRQEADLAAWISSFKGHPIKQAGDFLLAGWASAQRGRYAQAVAEAGTAIELLTAGVLRVSGRRCGYSDNKLAYVLDGPFANLVRDHFAVLLGYDRKPDEASDALGQWWQYAYKLRNRVVHHGHRPTEPETVKALEAAEALIDDLATRLSADERFEDALLPVPDAVWAAAYHSGSGPVPRSFEAAR